MKKTRKKPRSTAEFSTLDQFLEDEGTRDAFEAVAIEEVLAWRIAEAAAPVIGRRAPRRP